MRTFLESAADGIAIGSNLSGLWWTRQKWYCKFYVIQAPDIGWVKLNYDRVVHPISNGASVEVLYGMTMVTSSQDSAGIWG
ncbi:hypothetical protein J1N35_007184 [Gossypium stocksii]|uniref:Uncharacterized protein n=1 Tax=Gossypium stocksii TaxID=47602 RepID=A0A9D4AFC5_9ROSI|nr:hypothetical protein J1N35_007184 [Gossypium stocksii]